MRKSIERILFRSRVLVFEPDDLQQTINGPVLKCDRADTVREARRSFISTQVLGESYYVYQLRDVLNKLPASGRDLTSIHPIAGKQHILFSPWFNKTTPEGYQAYCRWFWLFSQLIKQIGTEKVRREAKISKNHPATQASDRAG